MQCLKLPRSVCCRAEAHTQSEHYKIACDIQPARVERYETPQDLDRLLFTALVDCNSMFQNLVSAMPAARVD